MNEPFYILLLGTLTVFIVNHVLGIGVQIRSTIERFRYIPEKATLIHMNTVTQDQNFHQ